MKYWIKLFLVVGFGYWAFHLVLAHNAQFDAIFATIISFLIYTNKDE